VNTLRKGDDDDNNTIKQSNLRPALYIVMQKAVMLNTCRIVRKILAEE
jgi:hypothetical protein